MLWRQVEGLGSLKEIKVDKYLLFLPCQAVHWARRMPLGKSRQVSAGALCPPLALGVSRGRNCELPPPCPRARGTQGVPGKHLLRWHDTPPALTVSQHHCSRITPTSVQPSVPLGRGHV